MQTSTQTNRRRKTTLLACLLTLLATAASIAQQMNYQGRLTDGAGNAVGDAQYSITFDIYDDATGGTKQWGPQVIPADTVQGRFNSILGPTDTASRNIINAFNGGTTRYLQITFQGNAILPRQQILAAPVAFRAMISDTVTNGAIGTAQIADGSITAANISGGTGVWLTTPSGTDIYRGAGNVGIDTASPGSTLEVVSNNEVGASDGTGKISAGPQNGNHIAIDSDDIQKYNNASQPGTLYLNDYGGNVSIGSSGASTTINGSVAATGTFTANGSIAAGGNITANGKSVVVGEENLRIVRGWATANTTVGVTNSPLSGVGSGFTWVKRSQGVVDVQFNTPFASVPCVTANTITGESVFCAIGPYGGGSWSGAGIRITMYDTGANVRDWPFNFIAIGPR